MIEPEPLHTGKVVTCVTAVWLAGARLPIRNFQAREMEFSLPVSFDLDDVPNRDTQEDIETVIRGYIGHRPQEEEWRVSIRAGSGYWEVVIKGPQPTRRQTFYDDFHVLPQNIQNWLGSYPFR